MHRLLIVAVIGSAVFSRGLHAQQGGGQSDTIPTAMKPPPGMCRVWLAGVPATKQPAPTDCPTAVRSVPPKARVIFGDTLARGKGSTVLPPTLPTGTPPTGKMPPVPTKTIPPATSRKIPPPAHDTLAVSELFGLDR